MNTPRRMVIITDGYNDHDTAKTAICLMRYRPDEIVAVLDRQSAGKSCQEVFGVGGTIPVVGSLTDASKANTFVVGIAPPGGKIPTHWRPIILDAIQRRLTIVSGCTIFYAMIPSFARRPIGMASNSSIFAGTTSTTWPISKGFGPNVFAFTRSATIAVAAR